MNPSRLGAGQMESSFPGKITDILVENKIYMSEQHPLRSGLHFRSQQLKGGGCSSSALVRHICGPGSNSGLPFMGGTGTY